MSDPSNTAQLVAELENVIAVWLAKVSKQHASSVQSFAQPLPSQDEASLGCHTLLLLANLSVALTCLCDHTNLLTRNRGQRSPWLLVARRQVPEGGHAHAAAQAAAEEACAAVDAAIAGAELDQLAREQGDDSAIAVAREIQELQHALERKNRLVADQHRMLESWRDRLAQLRDATPRAARPAHH